MRRCIIFDAKDFVSERVLRWSIVDYEGCDVGVMMRCDAMLGWKYLRPAFDIQLSAVPDPFQFPIDQDIYAQAILVF
jgi:hypothetical protein